MRENANYFMAVLAVAMMVACGGAKPAEPQVEVATEWEQTHPEGHYTYEHAFNYDWQGNHFDVTENGTMDFYADGTALDSAQQVYFVTCQDGDTELYVFNYVSPSLWHIDGDTFFFSGIKESFRMEKLVDDRGLEASSRPDLAQAIIKLVGGSIDYQYRFHLDSLTDDKLQWSFTYRDGHSDTWQFFRSK